MPQPTMSLPVFNAIVRRPSRASVAALGHRYILNGAGPALASRAIDAITEMACDWSVAILDQAIHDPTRHHRVRRQALAALSKLLARAIERGYPGATRFDRDQILKDAQNQMDGPPREDSFDEIQAVQDLCNHVSQAIADGFFGELPDF